MRNKKAKIGISCPLLSIVGIHSLLEWIISSFIDDDKHIRPCLVLSSINQLIKNKDWGELIKEMIQVVVVSPYPFFEYLISDRRGKDMIGISSIIHQSTRYE